MAPKRCGMWPDTCSSNVEGCQRIWRTLLFLGGILMVTLLPSSFVYFEYNQMGFVKYTINNRVDTSVAYEMGRYYTGPSHTAVVFPRDYQRIDSRLAIFPDNGQEFHINVVSFFRLNIEDLSGIYDQFGTSSVSSQVSIRIDSEIKSISPTFAIEDYILNRDAVTLEFFYGNDENPGLQADLSNIGVELELDHFWLEKVEMPDSIMQRNLDAAVQLQVNEQEENEREAILVQTETDRLEQVIQANRTIVNAEADATVQTINAETNAAIYTLDATTDASVSRQTDGAEAEAANMVATVDGDGLQLLFDTLGVNDIALKTKFIAYFALLAQK